MLLSGGAYGRDSVGRGVALSEAELGICTLVLDLYD
jgi:hypothetical protein